MFVSEGLRISVAIFLGTSISFVFFRFVNHHYFYI